MRLAGVVVRASHVGIGVSMPDGADSTFVGISPISMARVTQQLHVIIRLHAIYTRGGLVTMDCVRPAAYIRAAHRDDDDLAHKHAAADDAARQEGWPPPMIYLEDDADQAVGLAPVLARLAAAIEAGLHDALLISEPGAVAGTGTHVRGLLLRCARRGVAVRFLFPPAGADPEAVTSPSPAAAPQAAPFPVGHDAWGVLARARIEALSTLFPGWRIWLDQAGWHARRRDACYLEIRNEGAPAFSVHAERPADLAAQLCWQQAADQHVPGGCAV
jgi:hypothetical protein